MAIKSVLKNIQVMCGKRYKMEDNAATNFYCIGEMKSEENFEGKEIMKVTAPYEALDSVRGQLPGVFDIEVEIQSGGKDKMVLKALGMTRVEPTKPTAKAS